jgi:hypothetical protein
MSSRWSGSTIAEWSPGVRALLGACLFAFAALVTAWLIRPLAGPVAYDGAASVLYFERIVSGRHLEAFVNTTPKPLLTVLFGLTWVVAQDWRLISIATTVVTAAAVVMGAELARRLAGFAAAAFAFVGLLGLQSLQAEASWSHALPYALVLWLAAGLSIVRPHPRYGLAGVLLFLAALTRPETYLLLALATVVIVLEALCRRGAAESAVDRPLPREAAPLLVGWAALAVAGVHDWLLTGTPVYWTTVAQTYAAEAGPGRGAVEMLGVTATRLIASWPASLLAIVGVVALVRRRSWPVLLGFLALGPGVVAETLFFAWRGLNVRDYYLDPFAVVVVLAAGVSVGVAASQVRRLGSRVAPLWEAVPGLLLVAAVASLLAVVATAFTPLDRRSRALVRVQSRLAVNAATALPALRGAIAADPALAADETPDGPAVFVPRPQLARLVVDLDIPAWAFGRLDRKRLAEPGYPPVGSLVFFDVASDLKSTFDAARPLRVSSPATVDGARVVPLVAEPRIGVWVVRIAEAP